MNAIKKHFVLRNLLCLPGLLLPGLYRSIALGADLTPRLAQNIGVLSHKIDSLDLLKQNLKRKGATIAEIEQQQDALRDSLRMLRDNLQTASETLPKASGKKNLPFFPQKPTNPFDWIIVITGIIASFSGLMLIIGITRSLKLKRNRKQRKQEALYRYHTQQVGEKPVAAYPAYEAPPASSPSSPGIDTGSLRQLRQRLDNQQRAEHYDAPDIPDVRPVQPKPSSAESSNTDSIEKQVVDAARNGLDVAAISRKFHLSADHVALILKMAAPQS